MALARGGDGTGPRRGWHWPAEGVALARGGGGTGPRRGWHRATRVLRYASSLLCVVSGALRWTALWLQVRGDLGPACNAAGFYDRLLFGQVGR